MNSSGNKRLKIAIYSVCIVLMDQISKFLVLKTIGFERSKTIIPNLLNFTLVKNKGAAFSLFSNSTTLLTFTSIFASILLITIIFKFTPRSRLNSIGLAYLLGGTLGNGIDRLLKGYVLDFLELLPINFPIFNVADISINIAMIYFLIDIISRREQTRKRL
tara:strand:+ start:400 stop:882 length:483 start_codon:yes stop_codon:yes gene_type:complete